MAEVEAGAVAPVVPVAPAADAAPASESTADQVPETQQPEAKPERTFTQKEVNEIAAKRAAQAERGALKIARAEARAEMAERQLQERAAPQQQPQGDPQVTDFKDYEQYLIAKAKHELRQELRQREQESVAKNEQREGEERRQRLRSKFEAAAEEFPDIEERVMGNVPFTHPMVAYFEDSDIGPKVAYHLATNLKETQRIAQLSPAGQFRELVKLEAQITAPPKPTQAPPPIVPNGTQATAEKDPAKMSDKEFADWRRRQKAHKR